MGTPGRTTRFIDLSHAIEAGMTTYPGIPVPEVRTLLAHGDRSDRYAPGVTFHIGQLVLATNTGTYVDAPYHRYEGAADVAGLPLESLADLPCTVADVTGRSTVDVTTDVTGHAVLLRTGWASNWGTPRYLDGRAAPFLTAATADRLVDAGAALVGIDSVNIDDMHDPERPVHSALLKAGIPICEHLRGLDLVPRTGAFFTAVPAPISGVGTFPVRAYVRYEAR